MHNDDAFYISGPFEKNKIDIKFSSFNLFQFNDHREEKLLRLLEREDFQMNSSL